MISVGMMRIPSSRWIMMTIMAQTSSICSIFIAILGIVGDIMWVNLWWWMMARRGILIIWIILPLASFASAISFTRSIVMSITLCPTSSVWMIFGRMSA